MSELERLLGAAPIAFDWAFDWQRDRAKGEFNPLPDEAAVHAAIAFCQNYLLDAAQVCRRAFGTVCETSRVLLAVKETIGVSDRQSTREWLRELLQEWAFLQQKGMVQLNASGCESVLVPYCVCCCLVSVCLNQGNSETVHVVHHKGR